MRDRREAVDFAYVQADIPAGMTIAAWRAARRRRTLKRRSLLRWLRRLRAAVVKRTEMRDSSDAHGRIPA